MCQKIFSVVRYIIISENYTEEILILISNRKNEEGKTYRIHVIVKINKKKSFYELQPKKIYIWKQHEYKKYLLSIIYYQEKYFLRG